MLVHVRPSNEALLRARVPGAQHLHGCPLPILFHRARSASKKGTWPLPPHPSEATRCASTEDHQAPSPEPFPALGFRFCIESTSINTMRAVAFCGDAR